MLTQVAGDHALVAGAERDRRLAGEHAGAGLDPGAQRRATASTSSSAARTARSASSSWAVGRAPDGHHGVADELLDRPAVPARRPRVASVEVLRTGARGRSSGSRPSDERREADEVGEQDRDEAALGDRAGGRGGCGRRTAIGRRAAVAAAAAAALARTLPHSPQNRAVGALAVPQLGQVAASREPHSPQNLRPGSLGEEQEGQITRGRWSSVPEG